MSRERIFIHIPKTGGTTLECAIKGTKWMVNDNPFLYRHIIHETRSSNAGDIFHKSNLEKYQDYDIYTMLRHPVDHLISEYYFLRDRKEYFSLIKGRPKNLEQYARHSQVKNSLLNFLIGGRMYPKKAPSHSDLERVLYMIDNLPILVCIFEEFEKSLMYLERTLNLKTPKDIDVKRVTLNRPGLEEISESIKAIIEEEHALDIALYKHCKLKFDALDLKPKKLNITKDRYGYVMKYTERFNLMTLFQKNNVFESRNKQFLHDLNIYLHQQIAFENGKEYVLNWNNILLKTLFRKTNDLSFESILLKMDKEDPLRTTEEIVTRIEEKLKADPVFAKMQFSFKNADLQITRLPKKKTSFLGRFFGG